jgi:hypothetical protein
LTAGDFDGVEDEEENEEDPAAIQRIAVHPTSPNALWLLPDATEANNEWKSDANSAEGAELVALLDTFSPGLHAELVNAESHNSLQHQFPFADRSISIAQLAKEDCEHSLGGKVNGGKIWDCAVVMLRGYLQQSVHELKGKTILELGSGLGLTGISCVLAGAGHTVLTDAYTVPSLLENVDENLDGEEMTRVAVEALAWGSEVAEAAIMSKHFGEASPDIILASDVLFSMMVAPAFINTLLFMTSEHTKVILVYKQRRKAESQVWTGLGAVFDIVQLRNPALDAIARVSRVGIFELRRKPAGLGIKRAVVKTWPTWLAQQ